jgi:hypothetical protein
MWEVVVAGFFVVVNEILNKRIGDRIIAWLFLFAFVCVDGGVVQYLGGREEDNRMPLRCASGSGTATIKLSACKPLLEGRPLWLDHRHALW